MGNWIPVDQEQPKKAGRYLVTKTAPGREPWVDVCRWDPAGWRVPGVTAWMEIPGPFKGKIPNVWQSEA